MPAMRFFTYIVSFILFLLAFIATAKPYDQPLTIALVGSLSTDHGHKIFEAVSMQINEFNSSKQYPEVKLLTYDDLGRPEEAKKVVQAIKDQGNVLAIIGDFTQASDINAYNKLEIPILSPSILSGDDFQNPWLFRTLFNGHTEGIFLASYVKHVYNYNNIDIIYTSNFSESIKQDFSLPFIGIGGKIRNEWQISKNNLEEDIFNLSKNLLADQQPADAIFLATDAQVAAEIIAIIKRKGLNYKIFGTHLLTEYEFINSLSLFPEEQFNMGYFSNQVMAVSPIILDVGNEQAQIFKKRFIDIYKRSPNWLEASYFDSTFLATLAIKKALEAENGSVKNLRKAIRSFLFFLNEPEDAIEGITGIIYFDQNQERVPQIMMGEYFNQKLISAYTQLYPVKNQHGSREKFITANNQYLEKINIVFTDIDIIEISDLDLKTSDYVINFYLSFRYKGNIDAKNIEFVNQAEPIELGIPFEKITEHGITKESYRIEARFNNPFNFYDYPFDKQEIILKFQNKDQFDSDIFYVRDEISMSFESLQDDLKQIQKSKTLEDWLVTNIVFFQDTLKHFFSGDSRSFAGKESKVTRFTVKITIQRNSLSFALKNFLPLLIMLMLIYLVIYTDFVTAISVYVGAILATIVEHVRVSEELPGIGYTVALDYFFYFAYAVIVIEITLCIIAENYRLKDNQKNSARIISINKLIYPIVILTAVFTYTYLGSVTKMPSDTVVDHEPKVAQDAPKHMLTLSSWHSDNQDDMDKILSVFNAKHGIKIIFNPIKYSEYFDTLKTQLKAGNQPDLFYLPGNQVDSQILINDNFTIPLDIPVNHTLELEEQRNWAKDGHLHAIPVHAISQGVYYNKDIFNKLKISIPTTWEEFIKISNLIKKSGIIPIANGTKDSFANAEIIFMSIAPNFIGGAAGRSLFERGLRCFDDDSVKKSFMAVSELVPFLPKNHHLLSPYDARELFIAQKAAMWINGSWEVSYFTKEKPRFALSIFAIPAPKNLKTTTIFHYDAAIAINPRSDHKDDALEFLKWTQSEEYAKLLQDNLAGYFSLMSTAPVPKNSYAKAFFHLAKEHQTDSRWILPPGIPSSYQLMAKAATEVLNKNLSPVQAAQSLQAGLSTWYRPAQLCR